MVWKVGGDGGLRSVPMTVRWGEREPSERWVRVAGLPGRRRATDHAGAGIVFDRTGPTARAELVR